MRAVLSVLLLVASVALLAGCGGDNEPKVEPSGIDDAIPETFATKAAPREVGLVEACPLIEAEIALDDFAPAADYQAAVLDLHLLGKDGDAEVNALIERVLPGVRAMAADPARGNESLEAFGLMTDAREAVGAACG